VKPPAWSYADITGADSDASICILLTGERCEGSNEAGTKLGVCWIRPWMPYQLVEARIESSNGWAERVREPEAHSGLLAVAGVVYQEEVFPI